MPIFAAMSINDVRRRADEFEDARAHYESWLTTRRERRDHAADPDEQEGYAPAVQNGNPALSWRALEHELRKRKVWEVGDLPRKEQIRWAKKLNALSEALSEPQRQRIGPGTPDAQVRSVEPL